MWEGITTGFFIVLGMILGFVAFALVLVLALRRYLKKSGVGLEDGFSVELFEQYLKHCLENEWYEEAERARQIIAELQSNEKSELLKDYYIDSEPYMVIESKEQGQDIIRFKEERRVKRK